MTQRQHLNEQVLKFYKKEIEWNEFICSLSKYELRDFLDNEDSYMYSAQETDNVQKLLKRLKEENPDSDIHCYMMRDFEGITGRWKAIFFYQNDMVLKTVSLTHYDASCGVFWADFDDYGAHVGGNGSEEFKNNVLKFVSEHPEKINYAKEFRDLKLELRSFAGEELDEIF